MPKPVDITVSLVNYTGPSKKQAQQFEQQEIVIGRAKISDFLLPEDNLYVSRKHAIISRDGNCFTLTDYSKNGTFIDDQQIVESAPLKDGAVIMFSPEGPKIGFTFTIHTQPDNLEIPAETIEEMTPPLPIEKSVDSAVETTKNNSAESYTNAFTIQYGLKVESFDKAKVTFGTVDCQVIITGDFDVRNQHCEFSFDGSSYYVKDITGGHLVSVDDAPIGNSKTELSIGSIINLVKNGPYFKFLGDGRLVEYKPVIQEDETEDQEAEETIPEQDMAAPVGKTNLLSKLFSKK